MKDPIRTNQELLEENALLKSRIQELELSESASKQTEHKLYRLNRRLRAITDATRIVIHATDEVSMLEEVCQIIVEIGRYRMAWVGYAEHDNEKTVRPAAHKGFEDGYLDTVNITWADTERGRGPTGTAIRTEKTVIAQNILDCKGYEPWLNHALQHGYAASISVPLIFTGICLGALCVYASEPQAFDADEAKLMVELAQDLTFGISSLRESAARKRMEEELRESEKKYRNIFENVQDVYYETAMDGTILEISPSIEMISKGQYHRNELIGKSVHDVYAFPGERQALITFLPERGNYVTDYEIIFKNRDGSKVPCSISARIQFDAQDTPLKIIGSVRDISERKGAEKEKTKLQGQLLQAQKLESVGRLAGGVAHDFNNMLGVILGHVELAIDKIDVGQLPLADIQEIQKAAKRSSELTRQLLAFARKQTVSPKVIDINETVAGMLKMIQRLIGEDIHLAWLPGVNVWPIKIDPSQIDQVLANLCVNARDAIVDVGRVTLETGNVTCDELYCEDHADFVPGEYVSLAVSDNGCGMNKETLDMVFEPFFTTKEPGKGTGLGLATVYGIVKQNNGFINVYSEPDQGTTFKIYLPRHVGKAEKVRTDGVAEPVMRGQETILLAEDEPAMLELTTMLLNMQGYTVLAARTPGEAIRLASEHAEEIHLLITDVVMPEMNGRDLARNLLSLYPNLKRLFMSGYTANFIAHHGALDEGVYFIQKPFSRRDLAIKVREVLDQK